jgi:hypothetical protein
MSIVVDLERFCGHKMALFHKGLHLGWKISRNLLCLLRDPLL